MLLCFDVVVLFVGGESMMMIWRIGIDVVFDFVLGLDFIIG